MQIVTWNVNSLRVRLERVQAWLARHQPDVLCLQETKCPDEQFPRAELEDLGYRVEFSGQKGLNGVAILSKAPLSDVAYALPGRDDDTQRRYLAATVDGVRVINVYVPNGQALGSEAFFYKLDWLGRLQRVLVSQHDPAEPLVLLGDFNIAPADRDVHDPVAWANRLHTSAHERAAVERLQSWGLKDALRELHPEQEGLFSWFDYRDGSGEEVVEKNQGIRIDLILATQPLVERLRDVRIDLEERRGDKPSDHAPVVADFA
ncbi:MAG: exodeoxyribonuclease III [Planctomycetes bacterium]|nr:exodeoxyribonuclease III [Planctomycetota bacterium]